MQAHWHAEMRWERVLFVHWPVDPSVLDGRLPRDLSLDTFDGRAWVSVVALVMADVRPPGVPVGYTFPEVNLRTYVREGGVYFLSIEAAEPAGTRGRRLLERASRVGAGRTRLPYHRARVSVDVHGDDVTVESARSSASEPAAAFAASARIDGERAFTPAAGSVASFLTDRYRFHAPVDRTTAGTDERTRVISGGVAHGPWQLRPASVTVLRDDLFAAAGLSSPTADPIAYYSPAMPSVAARLEPPTPRLTKS